MHFYLCRANALLTFSLMGLALICVFASVSDNFNSPSPTAHVKVSKVSSFRKSIYDRNDEKEVSNAMRNQKAFENRIDDEVESVLDKAKRESSKIKEHVEVKERSLILLNQAIRKSESRRARFAEGEAIEKKVAEINARGNF